MVLLTIGGMLLEMERVKTVSQKRGGLERGKANEEGLPTAVCVCFLFGGCCGWGLGSKFRKRKGGDREMVLMASRLGHRGGRAAG